MPTVVGSPAAATSLVGRKKLRVMSYDLSKMFRPHSVTVQGPPAAGENDRFAFASQYFGMVKSVLHNKKNLLGGIGELELEFPVQAIAADIPGITDIAAVTPLGEAFRPAVVVDGRL